MKNKNVIELLNTGFVRPEFVKNVTHFFCRAVMYEDASNLQCGYQCVHENLVSFSAEHSQKHGVRPIQYCDNLLSYFFNQKNQIPGYVYYWLKSYYSCVFGDTGAYAERHYDIYNSLQREHIHHHRLIRNDAKDIAKFEKQRRRQLCRLYKSGEYSTTFALYGKPLEKNR